MRNVISQVETAFVLNEGRCMDSTFFEIPEEKKICNILPIRQSFGVSECSNLRDGLESVIRRSHAISPKTK